MSCIKNNIESTLHTIRLAELKYNRQKQSVHLLAVSKKQPFDSILQAIEAGQYQFGENYAQEGVDKIMSLRAYNTDTDASKQLKIDWHFIGPIQSNKTKLIAEHFDWVHSIDRIKIAQRLSDQCPFDKNLQCLIQVNISQEETKSGTTSEEIFELAQFIQNLPNVTLRGLMAIPQPSENYDEQKQTFNAVHHLYTQLQALYPQVDTLSMGMSNDMPAAIEAGSTMVRIGTAIFGKRPAK